MANGHGGKRPGAGRPPGSRDVATKKHQATIAELARSYTQEAIAALVDVMKTGSDAARVSAANSILDRAYGKPIQAMEVSGKDGGPIQTIDAAKLSDGALAELLAVAQGAVDEADQTDVGGPTCH